MNILGRVLKGIQRLMAFLCFLCTLVMGYSGISIIVEYGSDIRPLIIGIGMVLVTICAGYLSIIMWKEATYKRKKSN